MNYWYQTDSMLGQGSPFLFSPTMQILLSYTHLSLRGAQLKIDDVGGICVIIGKGP